MRIPLSTVSLAAAALAAAAWSPSPSSAQEAVAPAAEPEAFSVTIKGFENPYGRDNQPLASDQVTAEQLQTRQIRSLQELLQDLPNASLRAPSARIAVSAASSAFARDGNSGVNIRGLGGNRVSMSVDGVQMPHSYVSRSAIFGRDQLSLGLVKQVDIVRGPGSALQGFGGMAGSVNFTTWDPADFLLDADGNATRRLGGRLATAWDGDDRGRGVAATVAGQAGPSRWMLTATERRAHALRNRGDNHAADSSRTAPNPQRDRDTGWLGKWMLQPTATQRHAFALELNQQRSRVDLLSSRGLDPRSRIRVLDEDSRYRSTRDRLSWTGGFDVYAGPVDHLRTLVAVQRSKSRRVGESDIVDKGGNAVHRVRDNRYDETMWQLGLQADKTLRTRGGGSHRLTWGADYVRNRIGNLYDGQAPLPPEQFPLKRFPDTTETRGALYVQDEAAYGRWTITPGLRLDYYDINVTSQAGYHPPAEQPGRSRSGTALLPSLGVMFRATPEWRVYGQYARGFRPPDAGQLNDHFEALAPMIVDGMPVPMRVLIRPNPDLQPEKSQNLELGVRGRTERLSLDAAVFAGRYANLIVDAEFIEQVGMERRFQAVNIPHARIHGFEVKGRYDWGAMGPGRLASTFAYGQTHGRDRSSGRPLNSIMPPQLALGLQYDTARWHFFVDARHMAAKKAGDIDSQASVGDRGTQFATPSATTLDAGLQWRPRRDVRLNLAVRNLTNRKYWLWPDVYGIDAGSPVLDAYTRPGRSAHVSLIIDF